MPIEIIRKEVTHPKLTLAHDGRITVKIPLAFDEEAQRQIVSKAEELSLKMGIPVKTMRGRFSKGGLSGWYISWEK